MSRIIIDADALRHNLQAVRAWVQRHGASLTVVTKALCGHEPTLRVLAALGVRSVADSRTENLQGVRRGLPTAERWYLRPPHAAARPEVVALTDVSLNSELETVRALDQVAARRGLRHGVVVMVELGDLREGVLPGSLVRFAEVVTELEHVELRGIGSNLGCLSGTVPSPEQFAQLALYHELLELKFGHKLPVVSAGSSIALPLLLEGRVPGAINHFRVGEAILLGSDLVHGGLMPGLRDDVFTIEAEIVELKEKSLQPTGETSDAAPFGAPDGPAASPGQRGYRALVNLGQVDTDVSSLQPVDASHEIVGASSDITVVHLGPDAGGLRVGDTLSFRVGYAGLVRAMSSHYTTKAVRGAAELVDAAEAGERAALASLAPRRSGLSFAGRARQPGRAPAARDDLRVVPSSIAADSHPRPTNTSRRSEAV